ncbi:hypothetical protein BH09MYX1_BH09MYX1_33060 [soil metagenome]
MRWPARLLFTGLFTCVASGSLACKHFEDPPPPPFEVDIIVSQDKDVPLADAAIQRNNREVGRSDAKGKAVLKITGAEGDSFDLWVKCPSGFTSPDRAVTIRLQRLGEGKAPEYPVNCAPSERKVIVVLTAYDQTTPSLVGVGNVPVMFLGKEVATLDPSGSTTFMVTAHPGDHLEFLLDTREKKYELFKPQSPVVQLDVQPKDHIYPLEQPFTKDKVRIVQMGRPRPTQIGNGPRPL